MDGEAVAHHPTAPALDADRDAGGEPVCLVLPASRALAGLVAGYWYCRDADDAGLAAEWRTAPYAGTALTLHVGTSPVREDGSPAPELAIVGPQARVRTWRAASGTRFITAMLTTAGLATLFPGAGHALVDECVDAADVLGVPAARRLAATLVARLHCGAMARAFDAWLLERTTAVGRGHVDRRFLGAVAQLRSHGRVGRAAVSTGLSVRHLQRWMRTHAGLTPKQYVELERLQISLRRAQASRAAAVATLEYADQSHEIRAWRRHLGTTPARYRRSGISALARQFTAAQRRHEPYVAHVL
jgi:AraC-like DNA-binding protein